MKQSIVAPARTQVGRWRAITLRLLFVASVISLLTATPSMASTPGGIFSLHHRNDALNDTRELGLPFVAGLSVRFGWAEIEREPGQYDWSTLDKAHQITSAQNKQLIVRVIAGSASPAWLYAQGIPKVTFRGGETNWMSAGEVVTMPVPWDETYLRAWENFIAALGRHIATWQEVFCVQMTGGGFIDEMNLPRKDQATIEQWTDAGISDAKVVAMWKKIIAAYDKNMPKNVGLALDLGIPFAQSQAPEIVSSYALENYPDRVWLQQNGLKAERPTRARFPVLIAAASEKTVVGYQMLGGGKFLDAQTGDRRVAFEHAIKDGSSYVEVYKADLLDSSLDGDLRFLASGLAHNQKNRR